MSFLVLYADLRDSDPILVKATIGFQPDISALQIVQSALGVAEGERIEADLAQNDQRLIVSWYNAKTEEISEIGEVGSLRWKLEDNTILTITYQGLSTPETLAVEMEKWNIEHSDRFIENVRNT